MLTLFLVKVVVHELCKWCCWWRAWHAGTTACEAAASSWLRRARDENTCGVAHPRTRCGEF